MTQGFCSNRSRIRSALVIAGSAAIWPAMPSAGVAQHASAPPIENSVAEFSALDKVTARISKLEVPLNKTATFGSLRITPRVCYTRQPTEPPKTTSFVEVDEVLLDNKDKRIFTGWMFAESPGLNAVEHPVFDVWLTGCSSPVRTSAAPPPPDKSAREAPVAPPPDAEPLRRRRVPR
ncbi:MAG TPA: DUF2155 domain-containing protein [Hyphomicrobiaceae bacterium]|nr:DUF2155 domain-containing protein [Hyphomicrobiaceae bacterium]